MKFPGLFSITLQLLAVTPTLGCLHTSGVIGVPGGLGYAFSNDNGETTCTNDWGVRIDQDGHYSLTCLPGYVYAFSQDGSQAWYANPVQAFSWYQAPSAELNEISWDNWQFGCN
jgi:hypothetical protein